MALNAPEVRVRPAPIPLFRFVPEAGGDTHREEASERVFEYWKHAQGEIDPNHLRLPRLIVRDHCGRKIDIYTSYQEKIYTARRNVRLSGQAKTPEEWRLPHGPPPAKPDFSRVRPTTDRNRAAKEDVSPLENSLFRQQPFTVDVEDVSFVAESLRCLPDVASLSYLRHEFLSGNKLFLPILKACILHERLLSALDQREQQYHTPNLCTGCIRSGLCYGCDKAAVPHYHMDKVAKTGGGFTYYKRDRPGNPLEENDPRNWNSRFRKDFRELAKQIMAASELTEREEEEVRGRKPISLIPDFSVQFTQPEISDLRLDIDEDGAAVHSEGEPEDRQYPSEQASMSDILAIKPQGMFVKEAPSTARDSGLDEKFLEGEESQERVSTGFGPYVTGYQAWSAETEELPKGGNRDEDDENESRLTQCYGHGHGDWPGMDLSGLEGSAIRGYHDGEDNNAHGKETAGSENTGTSGSGSDKRPHLDIYKKRREQLYKDSDEKAPPAFKLKPREKRELISKSPFKTDRKLDVPKGEGFTIKKSDKKLTEFQEFKKSDNSWQEPRKFELKQNEHQSTKFWSPPPKPESRKRQKKSPTIKQTAESPDGSEKSFVSADSGLESERFQEWISQIVESAEQECTLEAEWGLHFEVPKRFLNAITELGYVVPEELLFDEEKETSALLSSYYDNLQNISPPSSISDSENPRHRVSAKSSNNSVPENLLDRDLLAGFRLAGNGFAGNGLSDDLRTRGFIADNFLADRFYLEKSSSRTSSAEKSSPEQLSDETPCSENLLPRNSLDSLFSNSTPPQYDSPGIQLTSPDLDLSLTDIGVEILPMAYLDPVQIIDSANAKKLRRKRKKRSKRMMSSESLDVEQVDVNDTQITVRAENEDDDQGDDVFKPDSTSRRIVNSSCLQPTEKYHSTVRRLSSDLTPEENPSDLKVGTNQQKSKRPLTPTAEKGTCSPGGARRASFRSKALNAIKESPEMAHTRSSAATATSSSMSRNSLKMKSRSSSTGSSQRSSLNSEKNDSRTESSKSSRKSSMENGGKRKTKSKPARKSSEKEFTDPDDELMKNLPSIEAQLKKLGIGLDSLNIGNNNKKQNTTVEEASLSDSASKGTELLTIRSKTPSQSRQSSPKPITAGNDLLSVPTTAERRNSASSENGKCNTFFHQSDIKMEGNCSLCGGPLENLALHICLPPISSRHKPKKAKTLFPKRVAHTRKTQKRIPVQEVSSDLPSDTKELLGKGNNLEDTKKLPPIEIPSKLPVDLNEEPKENDIKVAEEIKTTSSDVSDPSQAPAPVKPRRTLQRKQKKEVGRKQQQQQPLQQAKLPEIKAPPSVKSSVEDAPISLTPPSTASELSPLPPIEPPELPDFIFPEEEEERPRRQKMKSMIVTPAPTPVKEVKKARKPPPKVRKQVKIKQAKRRVAEAPVTREELQQVTDPLDFLAKYCIIHADRLPMYQRVFQKTVATQKPKYQRETTPPSTSRTEGTPRNGSAVSTVLGSEMHQNGILENGVDGLPQQYVPQLSPHEMKMLNDLTVINRAPSTMTMGSNPAEEYLDKLKFSFELLHEKQLKLKRQLAELDGRRLNIIANKAKEMYPDLLSPNSPRKAKKSNKKSAKKSAQSRASKEVTPSQSGSPVDGKSSDTPTATSADQNSDASIVQKLSNKAFDAVCLTPEVVRVEAEIERAEEKLKNVLARLEELQGETEIVKLYCMEYFFQSEMKMTRPKEFMRQQSAMYNSLHPQPDIEMSLSEVAAALQTINNHLLTDKEIDYLFHILNLPGRTRINFQLFSVLAALSERVAQLDPLIRKLINKLNYEALDIKMEKCKELFALLHDGEYLPGGRASASTLAVELTAGGLTPEHTAYVLSKFNRDGSGIIDFMDFVTYVPLFIEIHQRIVEDPLRVDLDL